jgi:hypothetical protein
VRLDCERRKSAVVVCSPRWLGVARRSRVDDSRPRKGLLIESLQPPIEDLDESNIWMMIVFRNCCFSCREHSLCRYSMACQGQ